MTTPSTPLEPRSLARVLIGAAGICCLAAAFASAALAADPTTGADHVLDQDAEFDAQGGELVILRDIVFPIAGNATFWNDWHQPRDNGTRLHVGTDIAAPKLTPVLAAVDGVIARIGPDDGSRAGNFVVLVDEEGWEYAYLHLNNDSPGTDDNANPSALALGPGVDVGARVYAGQVLGFVGDSGNAESTVSHVHFEIRAPGGQHINPFYSLRAAWQLDADRRCDGRPIGLDTSRERPSPQPMYVVTDDGSVTALDGAAHHGDVAHLELDEPIVAAAGTGSGYWLLGADGGVFTFGTAPYLGSIPELRAAAIATEDPGLIADLHLRLSHGADIRAVDLVPTPSRQGYWILMANGEVVEFGDARPIARPPVLLEAPANELIPAPRGGAWILATDGGVFAVSGAAYHGSIRDTSSRPSASAVALLPTPEGLGYTLIDADGAAHDFGDAVTTEDLATSGRCLPLTITAAVPAPDGGHHVVTDTGHVRTFGTMSSPLDDLVVTGRAVDLFVGPPVIGGLS